MAFLCHALILQSKSIAAIAWIPEYVARTMAVRINVTRFCFAKQTEATRVAIRGSRHAISMGKLRVRISIATASHATGQNGINRRNLNVIPARDAIAKTGNAGKYSAAKTVIRARRNETAPAAGFIA